MAHGLRFTLAHDGDKFQFVMHHLLAQAFPGSSIAPFSNAEDALKHILNTGADFLITGHAMGSMRGTDLIRELLRRKSAVPIIMVSGDHGAESEALDAGANEFLHKDLVLKHLIERVKKYLLI